LSQAHLKFLLFGYFRLALECLKDARA